MSDPSVNRRAPLSHYLLAIAFGAIATIAISLVVAATNPDDFWLAASIGALCAAYPSFSLGARIFVTNHTVTRDPRGEDSVESAWIRQAATGAFIDVLLTTIVLSVVLMITRLDVDGLVGPACPDRIERGRRRSALPGDPPSRAEMKNNLAERRLERGWTQADLASALGVSRQTVISIERGRFDPSLPLAFQIAQTFSCRIEDVFTAVGAV